VQSLFVRFARRWASALLCAGAVLAAGCHHNNSQTSGYGIAWVTLTDTPGDFTSYIVNVDSVTLTGAVVGQVTAVAAVETVDFTKLGNISELWSSASIPNDTYTSATITLDYTNANISVMVNGVPTKATVVDSAGAAVTTYAVTVTFDPAHRLTITPTYATTDAVRLALDFNLPASNVVNTATSPPKVFVKPFMTAGTSAADTKQVRVRGPLINSSIGTGTYTVYLRPFYDEANSLGSLSLFNDANTVYTLSGTTYVGSAGLTALSKTSAGSTMTAAYTNYEPTATPSATAGKFNTTFVLAGSTLEDYYTQGIEGDIIARSGNILTLRGSTLVFNNGASQYNNADAVVLIGPSTIVTADNNTALKGLDYNSIAVGQHIVARGLYSLPSSKVVTIDATGASSANTGSVRLLPTQIWGPVVASAASSLTMNLATIQNWPVSIYNFTGNGAAAVTPASFVVNTGGAAAAGLVAGDSAWIDGLVAPFGSAPPDFNAYTINAEASVPASLQVDWIGTGTTAPFSTLTDSGLTIDLANPEYGSGVIRIGSESVVLKDLTASPTIVPHATPAVTPGLPAAFLPRFSIGGLTSTASLDSVTVFNAYSDFVTQLPKSIVAATPALRFVATGVFDRVHNVFTATSIDVVN
jgi:sulfur transfer complex TusBCD TusB component (DsrH family)